VATDLSELAELTARTYARLALSKDRIQRARALLHHTAQVHACQRDDCPVPARPRLGATLCSIADGTLQVLAEAYELDPASVAGDSRALGCWTVPLDDFIVRLCRAHEWSAGTAAVYLGALRSAQQYDDPRAFWVDDGQ
jgi:hypothetical protein